MRKNVFFLLLLFSLTGISCVREVKSQKLMLGQRADKVDIRELQNIRLQLFLTEPRILNTKGDGEIRFIMRNLDNKPVRIPEWFTWESDNILVYCQNWLPDMTNPDPEAWIPLSFDFHKPAGHITLELPPHGQVTIAKKLPFVPKLRISPGSERRYFIRGELNLKSIKLQSEPAAVAVRTF